MPELLQAYLVVFAVNLAPGFMPPTWSILAFFLIHHGLPLLPLALGGAVAASAGRFSLAMASRRWGRRWLPRTRTESLGQLGRWLEPTMGSTDGGSFLFVWAHPL